MPFAMTRKDLEGGKLREISQGPIPRDLTYLWNLKKTKEQTKIRNRLIDTKNKPVEGGMKR